LPRHLPAPQIPAIFEGLPTAPVGELDTNNGGVRQTAGGSVMAKSAQKSSTGAVPDDSSADLSERFTREPPGAFAQVSYSIRRPLIALDMTSCWICSVPSKMSMVSRMRPTVSPESVTCDIVRLIPASPSVSGEF
jgi:hypothetical protein